MLPLTYQPVELRFGTSGRRGLVCDLTQLEVYIDVRGELEYLQSLPSEAGGVSRGEEFYFAHDLRPSSTTFVAGERRRGEICQAVVRGLQDSGMRPMNLGPIPTPALAFYALSLGKGSIMVTGSHIPFDRNGYKLNTSRGELLKEHEGPINESVRKVRERVYGEAPQESIFDADGMFKDGHGDLPPARDDAKAAYFKRYQAFFNRSTLQGKRIVVYQHSAVGRDLLVEILRHFGAEAIPAGRSETFVPIDTENITAAQLATIQELADGARGGGPPAFAVVSMDGDSDRPLLIGLDPATGKAHFFGGDLLGMITAQYLGADSVVLPISCNDAVDRSDLAPALEPKTKIGSPYVIAGMKAAREKGRTAICGWEANGGFLTGSDIRRGGRTLEALPTRDAVLPLLCALFAAVEKSLSLGELFATLPKRYSKAALLPNFPNALGKRLVAKYSTRAEVERFFTPEFGFGPVASIDYTDGVRITFANGEVAHFRPSGNADDFRIYAVADSDARAEFISDAATQPGGILRRMEKELT